MAHKKALLYRGTGNNPAFMRPIKRILKNNGFSVVDSWWSKSKYSVSYGNPLRWKIRRGSFDLIVAHSAGGFPMAFTRLKRGGKKLAINVFLTQYAFADHILHAKDDWLVKTDHANLSKVQLYSGTHSTVPLDLIDQYVKKNF